MFDFTKRAKRVLNEYAQQEAKRLGDDIIGTEHILLGLLREENSVAMKILRNLKISTDELKAKLETRSKEYGNTILIDISSNPDCYQKIIDYAKEEARRLRHNYVGTEHILLALLRDNNNTAGTILAGFNVNYSVIKAEILRILGVPTAGVAVGVRHSRVEKSRSPTLDEFARDLTQLAVEKKLLPVIGRNQEIQRLIQILCRKTKNNPVLVGEAGVGKTAIVEGLAERIIDRTVPDILFDKRVIVLDLASLVAGTKYRGEFEDRLKRIVREVQASTNVIMFIDELHTLIGAGAAEGAIDAANMLKPALARGEIQCIGATTLNEFRKYIEKDTALERRFQSILVKEPLVEEAVLILKGLKESFGKYHKVFYPDETIELAVHMVDRYINDRFLPDKAIDIIDEAGASARLSYFSRPTDILKLEEGIAKLVIKKDEMVKSQEYEKAAKIRDQINDNKNNLEKKMNAWQSRIADQSVAITKDDIYAVMSLWTGIPFSQMGENEAEHLLTMEKKLGERLIGQDLAIERVSRAVRRSRTGLRDARKPSGSFIFLGPTGVGKTELARVLADFLFKGEKKLLRLDMSEYMEPHSVSKLIGPPPGYVGYDDAGRLCEFVRQNPYCVVLFDEIEKAHPDIFNILLQVLDDATLTDTHSRNIDFSEVIIIMTSNIGAREINKGTMLGFGEDKGRKEEIEKEKLKEELKRYFNPEFLNRIDDVINFKTLAIEDVKKITEIMVKQINKNIFDKKLHLSLDTRAINYLAFKAYDEKYGVRPLRRTLQKEIEDSLAIRVLERKTVNPREFLISATGDCKSTRDTEKVELKITETFWKDYEGICIKQAEETKLNEERMKEQNVKSSHRLVVGKGAQGKQSSTTQAAK